MKRFISVGLCLLLILTSTMTAFADVAVIETEPYALVELSISSDAGDIEFIKKYQKDADASLSKKENVFLMKVNCIKEKGERVYLTADVSASMFGKTYEFVLNEEPLEVKKQRTTKMVSGCIEIPVAEEEIVLLDITATADFEKTIVSMTLYNRMNGSQQIMLYGDTFEEQQELFRKEVESVKYKQEYAELQTMNDVNLNKEKTNRAITETVTPGSAYEHVANVANSVLGGQSRNKEMMVMGISKCDPQDFGSGNDGYEKIRIFSRSYNLPEVDSSILYARPYRMQVNFYGDDYNLVAVTNVKPSSVNQTLSTAFSIFTSVAGSVATGKLGIVAAVISAIDLQFGDSISVSGVDAEFDISVNDLNWTEIDLPSDVATADAHENSTNGVVFTVVYEQDGGMRSATITVSSNITYQVFLSSNRTSNLKTGTATYTHTVNLN